MKLVGLNIEILGNKKDLQFSPNGNGGLDITRKLTFDFQKPGPLLPEKSNISPLPGPPLNRDSNIVRPPRQRVYQNTSVGPWVVYFRPKPNTPNRPKPKRVNIVNISRDLANGFPSVSEIKRVNPDKVRVVVGNLKEANAIVRCEKITLEYRVYILAKDVECDGKINEVPPLIH